jgi:hypothetical protein
LDTFGVKITLHQPVHAIARISPWWVFVPMATNQPCYSAAENSRSATRSSSIVLKVVIHNRFSLQLPDRALGNLDTSSFYLTTLIKVSVLIKPQQTTPKLVSNGIGHSGIGLLAPSFCMSVEGVWYTAVRMAKTVPHSDTDDSSM